MELQGRIYGTDAGDQYAGGNVPIRSVGLGRPCVPGAFGWGMHERGGWDSPRGVGVVHERCAVCPRHACEPPIESIVTGFCCPTLLAGRIFIGGDPQVPIIAPGFVNPPAGMTRMHEDNKPPVGQTVHIWWQQATWQNGYYRAVRIL